MNTPRIDPDASSSRPKTTLLSASVLTALAALWMLLRSGVAITPSLTDITAALSRWPERLNGPYVAFFSDSPLGALPARLLGLDTPQQVLLTSCVATVLAIAAYAAVAAYLSPNGLRLTGTRLALLAPLPAVLLAWLGFYDVYTVLSWVLCLLAWQSGRRSLLMLAGVLLGFQHFEHGVFGVGVLALTAAALRPWAPGSVQRVSVLWLLPGLFVGKLILTLVLVSANSEASGRTLWFAEFGREWTITAVNTGPTLLWALFAGTWALVLTLWIEIDSRRPRWLLAAAFSLAAVAMLLSGDRPRVFVIVTAPSVLLALAAFLRIATPRQRHLVEALVWIGVPLSLWGAEVVGENALDQFIMTWQTLTG